VDNRELTQSVRLDISNSTRRINDKSLILAGRCMRGRVRGGGGDSINERERYHTRQHKTSMKKAASTILAIAFLANGGATIAQNIQETAPPKLPPKRKSRT